MRWIKVKLTEIAKPRQWKNLPISEFSNEGFLVYGANGIIGKYKEFNHEFPTLAITCRGATCGTINITEPKSYITSNAMALDDLSENIDQKFLYYALKQRGFKDIISGSAQPQITREGLSKIELNIPKNKTDQIRIANILSKAEALIAQRKESINLLDELLKSAFLEMFGDPLINPNNFPVKNLTEFYINSKDGTKCGPFGSALKKDEYKLSGIPVWVMDNITKEGNFIEDDSLWIDEKKFKELQKYNAQNGDIIISRAGTVGKMCVLNTKYNKSIISTNLIRLRFNENLLPIYFVSLMNYFKGRVGRLKTGSDGSFTHMNTGILDSLNFPYPPLSLQNHFAQIVEKVETLKTEYKNSLTELENLYSSLSQKAFKGELDIKEKVSPEIPEQAFA